MDAVFNLSKYQNMLMTTVRTCLRGMYSDYGANPGNATNNLNSSFFNLLPQSDPEKENSSGLLNSEQKSQQNIPQSQTDNQTPMTNNPLDMNELNSSQIERPPGYGGGDAVQVSQALRMEIERMNWKHQAEIDEMQFNHELSLKEFKASQEIKNQKVCIEV